MVTESNFKKKTKRTQIFSFHMTLIFDMTKISISSQWLFCREKTRQLVARSSSKGQIRTKDNQERKKRQHKHSIHPVERRMTRPDSLTPDRISANQDTSVIISSVLPIFYTTSQVLIGADLNLARSSCNVLLSSTFVFIIEVRRKYIPQYLLLGTESQLKVSDTQLTVAFLYMVPRMRSGP